MIEVVFILISPLLVLILVIYQCIHYFKERLDFKKSLNRYSELFNDATLDNFQRCNADFNIDECQNRDCSNCQLWYKK